MGRELWEPFNLILPKTCSEKEKALRQTFELLALSSREPQP
jgi:hypothetical protein